MRFLALLLALLAAPLHAQGGNVVINEDVNATLSNLSLGVAIQCDDKTLSSLVRFALSLHGSFRVDDRAATQVRIGRNATAALVACERAGSEFSVNIEAKDEDELALKVADAIVVGVGRRWQLKPMYFGTKVAFVSQYSGHKEIYVTNLARSKTLRLTNYRNLTHSPRWSADGSRLNFISSVRTGFPELFSTNGIGAAVGVITGVSGALGAASAGPDGRLVFASSNKGTMDIYVCGAKGESPRRVLACRSERETNADPCWSPDGARFVLTSGPNGSPGVYLASSQGGALTRLSTGASYSTEPRWNPVQTDLIVYTFSSGGLKLGLLNLSAGKSSVIATANPAPLSHASWCADGRHVVAQQGGTLAVVDTVTGRTARLSPTSMGECSQPACYVRRN